VLGLAGAAPARVVAYEETPDATIAVVDDKSGARALLVDGFIAASAGPDGYHYMRWMGRLPMVMHPSPKRALVICFGTGQTANAVRREDPESLDVVDVNAAVFRMGRLFDANERVLDDPRVHAIVMDGRAWLRRTSRVYDVITLEPMPPTFAGVNALYAHEFYEAAARRLAPGGIMAQWLPLHLVTVHDAHAIATTFTEVFPGALLWMDPLSTTSILVGRKGAPLDLSWPGLSRPIVRDLPGDLVRQRVILGPRRFAIYAAVGATITDDDQLLAYGPGRYRFFGTSDAARANLEDIVVERGHALPTP
jgi:spermidine synthase